MSRAPIDVRRYGETGDPVVVLHGGPGAPGYMAPIARTICDSYQVHEPLQRLADGTPLTMQSHVDDLAEVAPERAHIVGASFGAMLGLSYASLHPERVKSLVLIGCGTYDLASRAEYKRRMNERLGPEGVALKAELDERFAASEDEAERADLFAAMGELSIFAQSVDPIEHESDVLAFDEVGHGETWSDTMRLQSEGIEPQRFSAITCNVLMVHGEQDPHPGQAIFQTLARHVLHIRYSQYANCGHEPWLERHAQAPFYSALRAWLFDRGAD